MNEKNFNACLKKQKEVKLFFQNCSSPEQTYQKIIELGHKLPSFPASLKTPENLVSGCQSVMHLHSSYENGVIVFSASSEALISRGLAALLIRVYSQEPPEVILTCPPLFLEELGIHQTLSPSRANGLANLFLKMKQEALKHIHSLALGKAGEK